MRKLKGYEFAGSSTSQQYTFRPAVMFRLGGLLVWGASGQIRSLKIAGDEQIIPGPFPLFAFESPFPSERVRELIDSNGLEQLLPDNLKGFKFPMASPGTDIELCIEGALNYLVFWGVEYPRES